MKTYLIDGKRVRVAGAAQLVEEIRKKSRSPGASSREFRRKLARRVAAQTGRRIPAAATPGRIVAELVAANLIEEVAR